MPHIKILLAAIFSLSFSTQVHAHPHEFVTMKIVAQFNKAGQMAALRYHWTFDEFFSAYALEGEDHNKNGVADPDELDGLLKHILGNIKAIGYFTAYDENNVLPDPGTAEPISATVKDRKLVIEFSVPYLEPVDLAGKSLRYAIYDDEFYIAMHHDIGDSAVTLGNAPKGCKAEITPADPDEDTVAFASSLGVDESSGGGLGASFAEWVTIACK